MLIYPTGETKTEYVFPPMATLLFIVASLACTLWVGLRQDTRQAAAHTRARSAMTAAVERQFREGSLRQDLWIKFREDPDIVGDPDYRASFSEKARQAWVASVDPTPPLNFLAERRPENLLLALTAHHLVVLLVGLFCLACVGYVLEHLYDFQVVAAMLVTSGCSWLLVDRVLPAGLLPSPVFAWSNTVLVFLLIGVASSPKAEIHLALRGWLIRGFGTDFSVPAFVFPVLFAGTYLGVTLYASPYAEQFLFPPLAVVLGEAVLLAVILAIMPSRPAREGRSPEQRMDMTLAMAKVHFESKHPDKAMALLEEVAADAVTHRQIHQAADLAWRNDEEAWALNAYRTALRKTVVAGESAHFLEMINEMLFRRIEVGGKFLIRAVEVSLEAGQIGQVQKLLPYFLDSAEVDGAQARAFIEHLADKLLAQKDPDRRLLLHLKEWLESHHPHSERLEHLSLVMASGAQESSLTGHFAPVQRVHRRLEVDLMEVATDRVVIQVAGQKEQRIPWTAFAGLFGCHISGENRGYRGCLVVRFKRKLFCCTFSTTQIHLKQYGAVMGFEQTWELLENQAPEDIPHLALKDFPSLKDDRELTRLVEDFINLDREATPP